MGLVDICKRLNINIFVPEIVARGDDLNVKGNTVKNVSKNMCKSNNIFFLEKHEYNSGHTLKEVNYI